MAPSRVGVAFLLPRGWFVFQGLISKLGFLTSSYLGLKNDWEEESYENPSKLRSTVDWWFVQVGMVGKRVQTAPSRSQVEGRGNSHIDEQATCACTFVNYGLYVSNKATLAVDKSGSKE
ncbi:hypothetical protein AMATHDRAFT_48761 [Amanita thiersii Skay4041]|uniref:Uncharacterized protein n=1 Tax=Amanita thiersii Skay4041 TaxID=703135 RepID=A0A2A9NM91_9AGAR|nr:hypothetical protein AMATHDRAFT_48761 [Amanita thiersii Skay4041]